MRNIKSKGPVPCVIGSFDTKGEDLDFIRGEIVSRGYDVLTVDTSIIGPYKPNADVPAAEIAAAAGSSLDELRSKNDRGYALGIMRKGLVRKVARLYNDGTVSGVIGAGGGAGTSIITAAMRELPIGVPKIMITTLASGRTEMYVAESDVVLFPSIVDIAGCNRISTGVYRRAVAAFIGLLGSETKGHEETGKPLIAATMFGNTTAAAQRCAKLLNKDGTYEPLIFHATGTGGKTMENLINENYISGVLDITTTEIADEVVGGVMSAGPKRLEAAGKAGIPQVVVPGCVDMVNFWARETVPDAYRKRRLYAWNPNVTLLRTNPEENLEIGTVIAEKLNKAKGPVAVFLPLKGVSLLDSEGNEFWDPDADERLFYGFRKYLRSDIPLFEMPYNINDRKFADTITEYFLELMEENNAFY